MKSLNNNVHCLLIVAKKIYTILVVDCFLELDSLKKFHDLPAVYIFSMFSLFSNNITPLNLNEKYAKFSSKLGAHLRSQSGDLYDRSSEIFHLIIEDFVFFLNFHLVVRSL